MSSFNQIPADIRVPFAYIEIDNSGAITGTPVPEWKMLVLGQKLAGGSAAVETPILVTRPSEADPLFGAGSMLSSMIKSIKAANSYMETWVIALDDNPAGVVASLNMTVTGPATGNGTLNLLIAGIQVQVGVTEGDTVAMLTQAINTAINAVPSLPVTSAVTDANTGTFKLSAKHKGECGNDIQVIVNYYQGQTLPAGVTLTDGTLAGGTGNPDITDALAAFGDEWWRSVVLPWTDTLNMNRLEAELLSRWGPLRMIDAITFSAYRGTLGQSAAFGDARNGFLMSCMATNLAPQPAYLWASTYGVVSCVSLSIDPARPLQTLALPGILPPPKALRWTTEERDLLLHDGMATHAVAAGDVVMINREVSMYQEDAYGDPDTSYLDITTPATLSYLRYSWRQRIQSRFGRHKLAEDGTRFAPGQPVVTPKIIEIATLALFTEWEAKGLVEDYDKFAETLVVRRSPDNPNRLEALTHPDLINQFRIFAGQIQYVL